MNDAQSRHGLPRVAAEAAGSSVSRLCPSASTLSEELGREAQSGGAHRCSETSEGRASVR